MIVDINKVKELLKSASFSTVSCLFNTLMYLVVIHYLSLNTTNASLAQNGISLAQTVLVILADPMITGFANGLKILYSQYYASVNIKNVKNFNLLLYQSIAFVIALTTVFFVVVYFSWESFFGLLGYRQETIEVSKVGLVYLYIQRIIFIVYELERAQLLGMKIFGPFAYFQTASFVLTTILCEVFYNTTEVGVTEAGILLILHDLIKVIILVSFKAYKRRNQNEALLQNGQEQKEVGFIDQTKQLIESMVEEKQKLVELTNYIKPMLVIIYVESIFFSTSIILSGKYSDEYIIAAVCFSMTNTLIFRGIIGLLEALISFAGTAFGAKDFKGAKEYLIYTVVLLIIYEGLFILGLFVFQDFWAQSFTQNPVALDLIHVYKYIYLMTVPLDGTQVLLNGYLQTVELKGIVQKAEIINFLFLGLPFFYILGDLCNLKLGGIWIAIGVANVLNLLTYWNAIKTMDYEKQYQIAYANQSMVKTHHQNDEEILTQELLAIHQEE